MNKIMKALVVGAVVAMLVLPRMAAADVKFGIKAGANVANVNGDFATNVSNWKSRVGFCGGIFLELNFGRLLTIQPEVLYTRMGARYAAGGDSLEYRFDYIQVPVMLRINNGPDGIHRLIQLMLAVDHDIIEFIHAPQFLARHGNPECQFLGSFALALAQPPFQLLPAFDRNKDHQGIAHFLVHRLGSLHIQPHHHILAAFQGLLAQARVGFGRSGHDHAGDTGVGHPPEVRGEFRALVRFGAAEDREHGRVRRGRVTDGHSFSVTLTTFGPSASSSAANPSFRQILSMASFSRNNSNSAAFTARCSRG